MSDTLITVVNEANNRLFAALGVTRPIDTWVQWGLRSDSTDAEIDAMVADYADYRRQKAIDLSH